MAIYSCNVRSIGKSTHASGTAGAHLAYIGREGAEPVILAEHMPSDPVAARSWMDRQEGADRKNARLGDKIRLALPRELSPPQRVELLRAFMADLTASRVPWFAGIHQTGEDRHNPHAHVFVRDRDCETGKRVLRLSDSARDRQKAGLEPKAVEWVRQRWEAVCNAALDRAGHEVRIDRRTLEAQGIARDATIHVGPRAQHVEKNVARPVSRVRTDGRGRKIDYPMIDAGRTRLERNAEIVDMNLERDARSRDPATRTWAKWEKEQRGLDQALEKELSVDSRRRTLERRRLIGRFRGLFRDLRDEQQAETKASLRIVREVYAPALAAMRDRHATERADLTKRDSGIFRRIAMRLDFTGTLKGRRDAGRKALSRNHTSERRDLAHRYRSDRTAQTEAISAQFAAARLDIVVDRDRHVGAMRDRHNEAEQKADDRRQEREANREGDREQMADAIQSWTRDFSRAGGIGQEAGRSAGADRASGPAPPSFG